MRHETGDIWALARAGDAVVVPVNVGWRGDGLAVLGRGLALQAVRRFRWLRRWWGEICQRCGSGTGVVAVCCEDGKWAGLWLVCFPVKPLNVAQPYLSWRAGADIGLIERGLVALARWGTSGTVARILVPSLGCGNGGLSEAAVVPLMERHLSSDVFVHVALASLTSLTSPAFGCADGMAARSV